MTTDAQLANRARLIERLRNPPPDRVPWDFTDHKSCALCDVEALGITADDDLGFSENAATLIFGCFEVSSSEFYGVSRSQVTAEMVAAKIEKFTVMDKLIKTLGR